jgi:hypothetical protein
MEITTPTLDVYKEKDDIVVKAELPGMEKDNIELNLSDSFEIRLPSCVGISKSGGIIFKMKPLVPRVQADPALTPPGDVVNGSGE